MTILKNNKIINSYKRNLSIKTRREIERFFLAFTLAWFIKTLLNEFPFFTRIFFITQTDTFLVNLIISETKFILEFLGYEVFTEGIFLKISGTYGIRYEFGCLATRSLTLFITFILVYFGKWYHKLWYITAGVFIITSANAIRGAYLCTVQAHNPEIFHDMHDIIIPPLMSLITLTLWLVWVISFGKDSKT